MSDLDELKRAIAQDDLDAAGAIVARDREVVRQFDEEGATALHFAALQGRPRIARLLIEQGAEVNARDMEFGATPAGWAIEYLRESGAQLGIELDDLAYAIETRDAKWVRRMLARFPRMRTAVYRDNVTFRQLAEASSDSAIAQLFRYDAE